MKFITESAVEEAALSILAEIGYSTVYGPEPAAVGVTGVQRERRAAPSMARS